ncbi:acyltransferase family protein [Paraburkholderia sp. BCC1885]|uniref:acyltransferase family protein n=1 Tax=Paraburkholderia sp. BCC1885 TaxID=2562669 RepID=UPI00164300CD|nr:acyltransferase [Paraburkholderia sp. BCC1885]
MKTNYAELHSLRGIAALIVVSTHFLIVLPQFYSGVTLHSGWLSVLLKYTPFHFLLGGHGSVVLFFALSGFVLAQAFLGGKKVAYGTYLVRRVLRIMPAYWVAILAACALETALPGGYADTRLSDWFTGVENQPAPTLDVILSHLLLIGQFDTGRVNPVVWSLVHEMRISIIFPFLAVFVARRPPRFVLLVTVLTVPLAILLQFYSASYGATLQYVPVFMFGILLAMHLPACSAWFLARSMAFRLGCAAGAFLVIYYVRTNEATPMWVSSIVEYGQGAAATLLMVVAISSARTGRVLKHSVARFFGDISYSLYLWHVPILIATIKLLGASLPLAVVMAIALTLAVLVSLVSFHLIERPFMALGKALTTKRSKLVMS